MAEAEIAFVAAAGAAGLALSVSAWAWRFRARMLARAHEAEMRAQHVGQALADHRDAALTFAQDVIIIEDGRFRLIGEGRLVQALGLDPALMREGDAASLHEMISRVIDAEALEALIAGQRSFALTLDAPGGGAEAVRIEGRASGALSLIRLYPAPAIEAGGGGLSPDAVATPVWCLDASGRLVYANATWLQLVGAQSVADANGRTLTFDRSAASMAREASRTGLRQESFRWTSADGRRRAWRLVAEPLGEGQVMITALEATEAEETRDTLRQHVAAHDETLNHLADAVAIFGPSRKLAFYNTAFQSLFELDAAWLDERPTHGELLDRLRQRRLLPETANYSAWKQKELDFYGATEASPDDSWAMPDGRTLRVVRQPHPLGGLLLLFSDITGEIELRTLYNAQIQLQTATLDKLSDAVAVFGTDGRLRFHNEAFEAFWGLRPEAVNENRDFDSLVEAARARLPDAGLWMELKARIADPDPESRVPIAGESRLSDGRVAAWLTRPLPDGATLVAFSDVTARRELEQALAQREAALEESRALKREFVGNVSYELRTPLTTILGYAELLELSGDRLDERSRQHAGAIRVAATHLARSIDDVLDMAQIDADEMALSLGDVNLAALLEDCADRARPRIEGRGAALRLDLAPSARLIRGDARRIAQAVDHLIDNAIRAVGEGGEVALGLDFGPSEARIHVSDTGRGIAYHLQASVFDRFVKRERGGPGLSLALVKALTELHGGWASVESEPGKGATFTLHLPDAAIVDAAAPELALGGPDLLSERRSV